MTLEAVQAANVTTPVQITLTLLKRIGWDVDSLF